MKRVLVVSPHPDDETLGCGGTLFKLKENNIELHWLIMTCINNSHELFLSREKEIDKVQSVFNFSSVTKLNYNTTQLDSYNLSDIIQSVSETLKKIKPDTLFIPHAGDVHSDHLVTARSIISCSKWFRYGYIKNVYCYETISETDFNIFDVNRFVPSVYMNISNYMDKKINVMGIYESELADHPFPRSVDSIKALAVLRGAQSGHQYAEAFQLLKQIID